MKNKSYIYDPDKHDIKKIRRCLYTSDNVKEINNPKPAITHVPMEGDLTLDEQVQRIMARTLAAKAAQLEMNSVEDIENAWDFDMDEPEQNTPFEFAAEALEVQSLQKDDELPPDLVSDDELLNPTEPEPEPEPDEPDPTPEPEG